MNQKTKERRAWIDKQPRRKLYYESGGADYLKPCKLCGNRFPFTQANFHAVKREDIYGLVSGGLAHVCHGCIEHWDKEEGKPNLKADLAQLIEEAEANEAAGKKKPIVPLAERERQRRQEERKPKRRKQKS